MSLDGDNLVGSARDQDQAPSRQRRTRPCAIKRSPLGLLEFAVPALGEHSGWGDLRHVPRLHDRRARAITKYSRQGKQGTELRPCRANERRKHEELLFHGEEARTRERHCRRK